MGLLPVRGYCLEKFNRVIQTVTLNCSQSCVCHTGVSAHTEYAGSVRLCQKSLLCSQWQ